MLLGAKLSKFIDEYTFLFLKSLFDMLLICYNCVKAAIFYYLCQP